jgi:two-component system response regulator LytT
MNIAVIEDEIKTAKALGQLILAVEPSAKIIATIQSVETAVKYLTENESPDLIFMDVQLADGLCFEIFKAVKVVSPVIFCTAFDEYAMDAFKTNGVDYVLKPFSRESIIAALDKVHQLKTFFQTQENPLADLEKLLNNVGAQGKKGFLVFKNNKYVTIQTENIAFFYIRNDSTTIVTFDRQEYAITLSLEEVHQLLAAKQFFRINRQYLINFNSVKEVEHYFARKLFVKLVIETPEKLLVGKDKAAGFLAWLDNR